MGPPHPTRADARATLSREGRGGANHIALARIWCLYRTAP